MEAMEAMQAPVLHGEGLRLRPLREDDLGELAEIVASPEVRHWWPSSGDPEKSKEELRSDLDNDPPYYTFAIEVEGRLAGWLAVMEEQDPAYRHCALDIILAPAHQGRGLGPEALRTMIRWLAEERGHHRFTIDPAAVNERAIKAYSSVGFRPVGVLRRQERRPDGQWRDGLLMDLLADELR